MTLTRRNLFLLAMAGSTALALLGWWGVLGKNVRALDVLAIFGGGFLCGMSFLRFLHASRAGAEAEPAPAPPKTKG
jgi:hypothetical protein